MSPLDRAIGRNHHLRRMRHWAAFRDLAGGEAVSEREEAALVSAVVAGEEVVIDGNLERFEAPSELDDLSEILDERFGGRVLVGLFTDFLSGDGQLLGACAAPWDRLLAALPPELSERDHIVLLNSDGRAVANLMRYCGHYGNIVWLKLAVLRGGEWRDVFGYD